jgi:hypothetical protein
VNSLAGVFMVFIIIGLSFICLVMFFVFMIFLPEWVGISGKNSEKTRAEHQGELPSIEKIQIPNQENNTQK